jgi:hypothetical protein
MTCVGYITQHCRTLIFLEWLKMQSICQAAKQTVRLVGNPFADWERRQQAQKTGADQQQESAAANCLT